MPEKVSYNNEEFIFREGDEGDAMYVINEGAVEVYRNSSNDKVVLATLDSGDFFGEMAILAQARRTANVVAKGRCVLTEFKAGELEEMIETRPDIAARMIKTLMSRVRDTTNKLVDEREKLGLVLATEEWVNK